MPTSVDESSLPAVCESLPPPSWGRRVIFLLVNVWLCFHLFAIVICPASVAPAAPIVQTAWTWVSGYVQVLFLNHGFHFFAPDPAGSTLVRYTLELPDGTTLSGRIPDRVVFPRLRYHRHFMVTEFLGNGPEEWRPLVERAVARNLCRQTGAVKATLHLVYHDTASVQDVLAGKSLNEPESFREIELGSFTAKELREPYQPPVILPPASEEADTSSAVATRVENSSSAEEKSEK